MISVSSMADWTTSAVKDEMRGTEVEIIDSLVPAIGGGGPKLRISIMRSSDSEKNHNITFRLEGGYPKIDCKDSCEISMRFDDYGVVKSRFLEFNSEFITPDSPSILIRAMSLAEKVYVEIPVAGTSPYQYKIDISGLEKAIEPAPNVKIFGIQVGSDGSSLPPDFKPTYRADCYFAQNIPIADGYFNVPLVNLCLTKNTVTSIIFDVTDKKKSKILESYLSKQFGSGYKVSDEFSSWPDESSRISYSTVSASRLGSTYVITDGIDSYFKK